MPRYVALIYASEAEYPKPNTPEMEKLFADYMAYTEEVQKAGIMQAGEALMPVATATTVRLRDGQTLTTDGPFADRR
jgi:hypothetical protein